MLGSKTFDSNDTYGFRPVSHSRNPGISSYNEISGGLLMNKTTNNLSIRWFYLVIGVIAMLFAGVLYAWSILKAPLAHEFGWSTSELALNFTLAMSFFCAGGLLGAALCKRAGSRIALIFAGILSASGFILTAFLHNPPVVMLYVSYASIKLLK